MRISRDSFAAAFALILFISISGTTRPALAYVPHSQTINARVVKGHGKGAYIIEQDVLFRTSGETLTLRERWIVENGEAMRLSVSVPQATGRQGENVRFETVYHGGKKTHWDLNGGGIKTAAVTPEFIESFFHDRSAKSLATHFVRAKIVPPSFLHEPAKPTKIEQIKRAQEPYVRLGRTAGSVSWVYGEPSPPSGKLNPGVWIEQDAFFIRRVRFPSEAELSADRYSVYSGALKFPRERVVSWGSNSATIRVIAVRPAPAAQAAKAVEPSTLGSQSGRLPDDPMVREFYSRFR